MKLFERLFRRSEDKNSWIVEASPGIARGYYTYFCARFDLDSKLIRPRFEVWSGVHSRVCWLEAGNSGLYNPNVSTDSPEELARQLYSHQQEIRERGENVIFRNQVPPTYSDLVLKNYMRTSIPPDLVFKIFLEMNRLNEVSQSKNCLIKKEQ